MPKVNGKEFEYTKEGKSKAAKYAARMEKKGKQIKVDKLARKQRTDEARERFKGGQIIKKHKFKKERKEEYKKAWEEGSWQD